MGPLAVSRFRNIGDDMIVNAPQTGEVVSVKTMWYSRKPMSFGRIP